MLTDQERKDYDLLINSADYPEYLRELIEKRFVEKTDNWYNEYFKMRSIKEWKETLISAEMKVDESIRIDIKNGNIKLGDIVLSIQNIEYSPINGIEKIQLNIYNPNCENYLTSLEIEFKPSC